MNHALTLAELRHTLEQSGFRAGLEFLNRRVPHRYTVVYRFDGEAFYGMALIDKQREPAPELFKRVPFSDSFCQYTVGDGVFRTDASLEDCRLDGHMHQANVQSYVGLPLMHRGGTLYGTFCHLDVLPQNLGDDEYAFLQQAVMLFSDYLPTVSEL